MAKEIFKAIDLSKQSIPSRTYKTFSLSSYFHIANFEMSYFPNNSPITLKFYNDDTLIKTITIKGYQNAGVYEVDAIKINKISASSDALSAQTIDLFVFYALSEEKSILLQSNNKTYSLEQVVGDYWYEPKMTSDTAPFPFVASASSTWSSTYQAWKAFNGTNNANTDAWITARDTIKGWVQLDFGSHIYCNQIKLTSRYGDTANACPKDFTISASNDGVNFDVIANITGQKNWKLNETRIIQFRNSSKYRIYRLTVISNDGYSSYSAIGQLQFGYGRNHIIEIPKCSQDNFINYGQIELSPYQPITIKSYILQDEVSKNDEGLWTTKLDRKPLSISFK